MDDIKSMYLHNVLGKTNKQQVIEEVLGRIKNSGLEFDAIACCGYSGLLVAPIIAYLLSKHLIVVRKKNDSTHSICEVEGMLSAKTYIIIDDFMESGKTITHIKKKIREIQKLDNRKYSKLVGTLLYFREAADYSFDKKLTGQMI